MKEDLIRQTLGGCEIIELIGQGGMATVYRARQLRLERDVAIKVMSPTLAADPTFRQRFEREAQASAGLRHPNILTVHDFGETDQGQLYLVVDYVQRGTLRKQMQDRVASPSEGGVEGGAMPLAEALEIVAQVADALDYAHNRGIVHRDVKPSNILLTREGRPLLADFGLVKPIQGDPNLTEPGKIMGTPAYMSPEQAIDSTAVDGRADIYALGVTLFELFTGQCPFEDESPFNVILKHINDPLPRPSGLNQAIPPALDEIVAKATAKSPDERYQRARDMARALRLDFSPIQPVLSPPRLFISYKHNVDPDQRLANYLCESLTAQGHDVFIDNTLRSGKAWLQEIDQQIKASDLLIVLLSEASADSEMVQAEVRRAYEYRKLYGRPRTLPVRIAYEGLLPYAIDIFVNPFQYAVWKSEADDEHLLRDILDAVDDKLPERTPISVLPVDEWPDDDQALLPPQPDFDPRLLTAPGGAMKLRDRLYVRRKADALLENQIIKRGTTTTIRAPRQTGKTSLLIRGIHYARQSRVEVVFLDLQRFGSDRLVSSDVFLQELAWSICDGLDLDEGVLEQAWKGSTGALNKLTRLMERHVLPAVDGQLVLAIDEADCLLQTDFYKDFFGLLRSWHNSRALYEVWEKLNLVLVISTEPYLLIDDIHQSPFNVGLGLELADFDEIQVHDLNRRHGSPLAESDIAQFMDLLHGHPFLVRRALYVLVTQGLSWPKLLSDAPTDHGPFGDHLRRQYWIIHDKPELKEALKEIMSVGHCSDQAQVALYRLLRAGLVKGSGNVCDCRCGLYRLYFGDKLF